MRISALRTLSRGIRPSALPVRLPVRCFASARVVSDEEFKKAQEAVNRLPSAGNDDKLQLYALFKQATVGKNSTSKPGMFDVVGKYKWEAWTALGDMSPADARVKYVEKCVQMGADLSGKAPAAPQAQESASASGTLVISDDGTGVRLVTLNRPDKRNAISQAMYFELMDVMDKSAEDPSVRVLVLTGAGAFYSSGNDLSNFAEMVTKTPGGLQTMAEAARVMLHKYVGKWISFPKPLIVGINGPAVGIAVTTLPLADCVVASDKATFHAPLANLGQTPEGTSSVTFPALFGMPRAMEILVGGRKLSAHEAKEWGLANDVIEDAKFAEELQRRAKEWAALPPKASAAAKRIMRERSGISSAALAVANEKECELIKSMWLGDECMSAVAKFLTKKK